MTASLDDAWAIFVRAFPRANTPERTVETHNSVEPSNIWEERYV